MSLRRRLKRNDDSSVDVTPMLDIVFIMLIFFIVTATFLDETGLDFTIPDEGEDKGKEAHSIQVYVDETNRVSVDGKPTEIGNVPYAVETLLAYKPGATVTLSAHYSADLSPVVRIKDKMLGDGRKTIFKVVK